MSSVEREGKTVLSSLKSGRLNKAVALFAAMAALAVLIIPTAAFAEKPENQDLVRVVRSSDGYDLVRRYVDQKPAAVQEIDEATSLVIYDFKTWPGKSDDFQGFHPYVMFFVDNESNAVEGFLAVPDADGRADPVPLTIEALSEVGPDVVQAQSVVATATCWWCSETTYIPGHMSSNTGYNACTAACAVAGGSWPVRAACMAACWGLYYVPGHTVCTEWSSGPPCPE